MISITLRQKLLQPLDRLAVFPVLSNSHMQSKQTLQHYPNKTEHYTMPRMMQIKSTCKMATIINSYITLRIIPQTETVNTNNSNTSHYMSRAQNSTTRIILVQNTLTLCNIWPPYQTRNTMQQCWATSSFAIA